MELEHRRGKEGNKPRTGASGTEQNGRTATSAQGTLQGTADQRHRLAHAGRNTAARRRPPGLKHARDA